MSTPDGGFPPIYPKDKGNLLQEGKIKFQKKEGNRIPKLDFKKIKK